MAYTKIGRIGERCYYCEVADATQWDAVPRVKNYTPFVSGVKYAVCRNCWSRIYRASAGGHDLPIADRIALIQGHRKIAVAPILAGFKPIYNASNTVIGYDSQHNNVVVTPEMMDRAMSILGRATGLTDMAVICKFLDEHAISGSFKDVLSYYILGLVHRA